MNEATNLPVLVRRAAEQLASATSAAEILDARDMASIAYDLAKKAGRLAKAKEAHDEIIVKAAHAQADALEIESVAKRRLADEYDAAQERGEVRQNGERSFSTLEKVGGIDLGLTGKDIHEARTIRDAEQADPGIVRRSLDGLLDAGEEPTRAALKREIAPASNARKPIVSDAALWIWGRLRDFERNGYFGADPRRLLDDMTEPMRADCRELLPRVRDFLDRMEDEINGRT
jgi:hypothetical protein